MEDSEDDFNKTIWPVYNQGLISTFDRHFVQARRCPDRTFLARLPTGYGDSLVDVCFGMFYQIGLRSAGAAPRRPRFTRVMVANRRGTVGNNKCRPT